jgi:hypothetical protein
MPEQRKSERLAIKRKRREQATTTKRVALEAELEAKAEDASAGSESGSDSLPDASDLKLGEDATAAYAPGATQDDAFEQWLAANLLFPFSPFEHRPLASPAAGSRSPECDALMLLLQSPPSRSPAAADALGNLHLSAPQTPKTGDRLPRSPFMLLAGRNSGPTRAARKLDWQ